MSDNNWSEYQKLILHQLKVLTKAMDENREDHSKLREEITTLKVKSGAWGLFGGSIPVIIGLGIWILKGI